MIDIVTVGAGGGSVAWSVAGGRAEGRPPQRRRRPRPALLRPRRHRGHGHRRARRPRPHPAAPARRRDPPRRGRRGRGRRRPRRGARPDVRDGPPRASWRSAAWNQANAIRQITVKRGLDVRDYPLVAFGGSGPLLACRLVDVLGMPAALVPREPGQRVGVRAAHGGREERLRAHRVVRDAELDPALIAGVYADLEEQAVRRPRPRGLRPRRGPRRPLGRPALLRAGVRGAGPRARRASSTTRSAPRSRTASTTRTSRSTATATATTRATPSSGSICASPASARSPGPTLRRSARRATATRRAPAPARGRVYFDGCGRHARLRRETLAPGDVLDGPGRHRGVRLDDPAAPGLHRDVDRHGNLVITATPARRRL